MYYGMYVSAAGAQAQSQRMEVISHNLANSGTAGFKRELGIMQSRASEAIERGLDYENSRSINDIGGGVNMTQTATDFSVGPVRETKIDTDFALENPNSFFVVQKGEEQLLTRAGNFHFMPTGTLVTEQGYPVLGADGSPLQIDPNYAFSVTRNGELEQAGERRPLGLKQVASLPELTRIGENLFSTSEENMQDIPETERSVHWRHLEMSSVQPQTEMIRMIETSRAYEANIRMIQSQDAILNSLLGRVLRA